MKKGIRTAENGEKMTTEDGRKGLFEFSSALWCFIFCKTMAGQRGDYFRFEALTVNTLPVNSRRLAGELYTSVPAKMANK